MTRNVTVSYSRTKTALAVVVLAGLSLTLPAHAQERQEQRRLEDEPDLQDVALTPLSDLNLRNDPIPDILLAARNAPYDQTGLRNCRDVRRLVEEFDAVLGADYDTVIPDDRSISPGNIAQRIIGSFIPFRGIIREVSGANEHERDFREAIAAGMMRRAYLKGRGQSMGCAYPARPATEEEAARMRAELASPVDRSRDRDGDEDERRTERRNERRNEHRTDEPEFVSRPVVQDID